MQFSYLNPVRETFPQILFCSIECTILLSNSTVLTSRLKYSIPNRLVRLLIQKKNAFWKSNLQLKYTRSMVKKQSEESWQTASFNMNTSSHIRKYMDLCKEWYISNDNEVNMTPQFCNIAQKFDNSVKNRLGLHDTELRNITSFMCYICKQEYNDSDKKTLTANPFTRAQYVLLCTNCNQQVSSNR